MSERNPARKLPSETTHDDSEIPASPANDPSSESEKHERLATDEEKAGITDAINSAAEEENTATVLEGDIDAFCTVLLPEKPPEGESFAVYSVAENHDSFKEMPVFYNARTGVISGAIERAKKFAQEPRYTNAQISAEENIYTQSKMRKGPAHVAMSVASYGYKEKKALNGNRPYRTTETDNVGHIYALVVDHDSDPEASRKKLRDAALIPTIENRSGGVTASGGHKGHDYFVFDVPLNVEDNKALLARFKALGLRAIRFCGSGDESVASPVHPLRIPGGVHRKAEDKQSRLISCDGPKWTLDKLEQLLDAAGAPKEEPKRHDRKPRDQKAAERLALKTTIRTGGPGLHNAINALAMMLAHDGMEEDEVEYYLQTLLGECEGEIPYDRFNARMQDIPRAVRSAYEKVEDSEPFKKNKEYREKLDAMEDEEACSNLRDEVLAEIAALTPDSIKAGYGSLDCEDGLFSKIARLQLSPADQNVFAGNIKRRLKAAVGDVRALLNKWSDIWKKRQNAADGDNDDDPHGLPDGFHIEDGHICCNDVKVCGQIKLKRAVRTQASHGWSYEYELVNAEGKTANAIVKHEDRGADFNKKVVGVLMDRGLWIASDALGRSHFQRLLNEWQPAKFDTLLTQPGYHSNGDAFTHLSGTIVRDGSDLDASSFVYVVDDKEKLKGTLEGWRTAVSREFLMQDDRQCMALHLLQGAASQLLFYTGKNSTTLHTYGGSGQGKTTSQRFQVSVWGRPTPGAILFPTMKGTKNALEFHLPRANDMTIAYDEGKLADAKTVVDLGFNIDAGHIKSRLTSDIVEKPSLTWRVTASYSTEQNIEQYAAESKQTVVAGGIFRALQISVAGIKKRDPSEVANRVRMLEQNYGHAGPALVAALFKRGWRVGDDAIVALVDDYVTKLLGDTSDAERSRLHRQAAPFAMMGVIGGIMSEEGIIDWSQDDVLKIVSWGWNTFNGGSAAQKLEVGPAAIQALKAYVVTHLGSTVVPKSEMSSKTFNGMVAVYDEKLVYLHRSRIRDIVGLGTDEDTLIAALDQAGLLLRQGKNKHWVKGLHGVAHYRIQWAGIGVAEVEPDGVEAAKFGAKPFRVLKTWRRRAWK